MNRVVITEKGETEPDSAFSYRHPQVAYVFGDMVRGLYVVGCLAIDVFTLTQVHLSSPSLEAVLLPPLVAGLIGLGYLELRFYRSLWPASRRARIAEIVERKTR